MTNTAWTQAPLVAIDLEGTGAQDRDDEAILEIAVVPIIAGRPSLPDSYTTLINPERRIPRRPWISPGLTDQALATAPTLNQVEPELTARLDGRHLVAHNINVDWRLLHRRCPRIRPAGLIDTLRLARHVHPTGKHRSLTALLDHHGLTEQTSALAPTSQPHRAVWDATGTALLLSALLHQIPDDTTLSLAQLNRLAAHSLPDAQADDLGEQPKQLPLMDL